MHKNITIALFALSASAAAAEIIRYDFTGTVTFVTAQSQFTAVATVGDPVDGVFMYDTGTGDTTPGDQYFGSYPHIFDNGFSFYFPTTTTLAVADAYQVLVTDDNPPNNTFDELEVYATEGIEIDGVIMPTLDMYVQFRDDTGTVFNDDSLPGWELTLADFPDTDGLALPNGYILDVVTGARLEFSIDSLSGVPAPGTVAGLAVGALCLTRRRRD